VYECQSPSDSSELPGHLDASLPARELSTYIHPLDNDKLLRLKLKREDTVTLTRSHEQIAFKHETKVTHVLDGLDEGRSREGSKC